MNYCTKCGYRLNEVAAFCPMCGSALNCGADSAQENNAAIQGNNENTRETPVPPAPYQGNYGNGNTYYGNQNPYNGVYPNYPPPPHYYPVHSGGNSTRVMSILAIVFSGISLVVLILMFTNGGYASFSILTVPLAITGFVLGMIINSRKKNPQFAHHFAAHKGLMQAAITLSIICFVLYMALLALGFIFLFWLFAVFS